MDRSGVVAGFRAAQTSSRRNEWNDRMQPVVPGPRREPEPPAGRPPEAHVAPPRPAAFTPNPASPGVRTLYSTAPPHIEARPYLTLLAPPHEGFGRTRNDCGGPANKRARHGAGRALLDPTGGWSDDGTRGREPGGREQQRCFPAQRPPGWSGGRCRRRSGRRQGADGAHHADAWPRDAGRSVRGRLDRPRGRSLHRGVPDEPADPEPVQRSPADPAGGEAADAGRGGGAAAARRARVSVSRTRCATRPTSSGRTRSGSRIRSSTSSTCWSAPTRSPRRRCCRSTRWASRSSRSTRPVTPSRPGPCAACRRRRSTGSTGRSRVRGSTSSTAGRCWSGSRTTWTRTRSTSTGRTSGRRTSRS